MHFKVPSPLTDISLWFTAALLSLTILLYNLYQWLRPRPFLGIPYNQEALQNLFGDIPNMLGEVKKTKDMVGWLLRQAEKHKSPLVQVFIRPFSKPSIILTDYREAQDILFHRSREFDRTPYTYEVFSGIVPNHHIHMQTGPVWKAHRKLLQDLMTPTLLNNTAAPAIYEKVLHLVDLWQLKTRLAAGRPFSAAEDIHHAALDAVLSFSFGNGFPHSATKPQIELLSSTDASTLQGNSAQLREPVKFPEAKIHDSIKSMLDLTNGIEHIKSSISPRLMWWIITKMPYLSRAKRIKDTFIQEEIKKATDILSQKSLDNGEPRMRSAVELIVDRQETFAKKDEREPNFFSSVIFDEVFGFVVAGHDTTSTTTAWGIKLLADNPDAQARLRAALHSAFPEAAASHRRPLLSELLHTCIPDLDATLEEILRCAPTVPIVDRVALHDTVLLGHFIPKGTSVFLPSRGPSFSSPPYAIDEKDRSLSSQNTKSKAHDRVWDMNDMNLFLPERWLVPREKSNVSDSGVQEVVFDSTAGPKMAFGGGPRGCYGRRLAYLELKLLFSLIVWDFELLECPKELSGYQGIDGVVHKPVNCYVRLKQLF